jgi:hypothetical protein
VGHDGCDEVDEPTFAASAVGHDGASVVCWPVDGANGEAPFCPVGGTGVDEDIMNPF